MVAAKECKHLAAQLFAETVARHDVEPGLTVHSDRGAAMKSDTLAQLLATLGVGQSFSRTHVSDDNAFSEAQFKTLKYQPDYPGLFTGELHARGWLPPFFGWHNDDHHHSGLALFTPAQVFFGRVAAVHSVRQEALNAAYACATQVAFPTARQRPPCRLQRCTSTRSKPSRSRSETQRKRPPSPLIVVNISSWHVDDPLPAIRSGRECAGASRRPRSKAYSTIL